VEGSPAVGRGFYSDTGAEVRRSFGYAQDDKAALRMTR